MPGKGTIPRTCVHCAAPFLAHHWSISIGAGRYCSRTCKHNGQKAPLPVVSFSADGKTASIPILNRHGELRAYILVDSDDAGWAGQWVWHLSGGGYAARFERVSGKRRIVKLHRAILGLKFGDILQGDHINRDRLDNRRINLRIVTNAQNEQNKSKRKEGASRFRGVQPNNGKWTASVTANGKRMHLGSFSTEEEAGAAALKGRMKFLPFAVD